MVEFSFPGKDLLGSLVSQAKIYSERILTLQRVTKLVQSAELIWHRSPLLTFAMHTSKTVLILAATECQGIWHLLCCTLQGCGEAMELQLSMLRVGGYSRLHTSTTPALVFQDVAPATNCAQLLILQNPAAGSQATGFKGGVPSILFGIEVAV